MKNKITTFITIFVLITAVAIPVAFAAENEDSKAAKFFESMFDFHRNWVEKSVAKGEITEEEAEQWNEHFDVMEEYHEENGFGGHCGVAGPGNGTYNQSYRSNFGRGMMGSPGSMMNIY